MDELEYVSKDIVYFVKSIPDRLTLNCCKLHLSQNVHIL